MSVHFVVTKKSRAKNAKRRRHKGRKRMQTTARTITIDPGRSNLVMARDSWTGKYTRLTRRGYRKAVGFDNMQRREAQREMPLRGVIASLSKTSIRTCNRVKRYMYRQVLIRNYTKLWSARVVGNRFRDKFNTYIKKNQVLDKFFSNLGKVRDPDTGQVVRAVPKPTVVYGAASIHPTGKGEQGVPVKYVYKVCCRHFHTVKENEYLSTKVCNDCHNRLHPVAHAVPGNKRGGYPVRGLLWCPTCKKFVNRDKNATKNIEHIYNAGEERPDAFKFGQKRVAMKKLVLLPPKLKRSKKNRSCEVSKRGKVGRKKAYGKTSSLFRGLRCYRRRVDNNLGLTGDILVGSTN